MSKFIQIFSLVPNTVHSWWVNTNIQPLRLVDRHIKQCMDIRGLTLPEMLVGELWCWFLIFIFIPLAYTVFIFDHTGFYFTALLCVDLLTAFGDGVWLATFCLAFCFYFWESNRFALIGPFSMLILVLTGIRTLQLVASTLISIILSLITIPTVGIFSAISVSVVNTLSSFAEIVKFNSFIGIVSFSLFTIIFLASRIILVSSGSSIRRLFWQNRIIDQIVLVSMAIIFSILLLIADNFLFLFLVWVGLNLSLYGLLAQFSFSLKAQEAAIKYFILGLISAGFFLFGIWLLYLAYGSIDFSALTALIVPTLNGNYSLLGIWGAMLILAVLLFKLSAFPFQSWALDVYEGSSWFALSILILIVKPVFLILLIKSLFCFSGFSVILGPIVFFSGILSLLIGTIGAAFQQKIKRFLSMSSISHIGFMLVLLGLDFSNFTLTLNYLLAYLVSNFIILSIVSSARISGPLYPVSRSVVYWSELSFLNGNSIFRSPRTLAFSVALLSLAGLPPFLGFFTKLGFFSVCISKLTFSSILGCFVGLASMPIGVYNYLRIIRILWIGDCNSYKSIFFVNILSNYTFNLVVASSMCILIFGGLFII